MTDYVWYACYGSNLLTERFSCYIGGGRPANAKRIYPGCSDKTLPKKQKPAYIPYELYFAKSSKTWSGGGAGFINSERKSETSTLGKMYLITQQQFVDLVQQEVKLEGEFDINLNEVINAGQLDMKNGTWYDRILYLGKEENAPVFTFTNSMYLKEEINPPHPFYLRMIIEGLRETYQLENSEIGNYLKTRTGIKNTEIEKDLSRLIGN